MKKKDKRIITIVYDRHIYTYKWLKVLYACRNEFSQLGYRIKYQGLLDFIPSIEFKKFYLERRSYKNACKSSNDIVMMAFHHSTSELCQLPVDERIKILKQIKTHCNLLIWLDTADSTGTCMFDVMPYVDLYFKKQVLVKKEDYCSEMYGSRSFCDYYHNLLGIEDLTITSRYYPPTESQYLSKIRLSWNVGLGDLYIRNRQIIMRPHKMIAPIFLDPMSDKKLDLQYRGSGYSPIAGYPRSKSQMMIKKIKNLKVSDVTKKVPKDEYIKEGMSAKSILSPFGWGEICGRDFEAIVYGACMIKQDMSHCETYPNVYQANRTYVPLKWDFSDFNEKISKAGSEEYRRIAKQSQDYYKFFFTSEGRYDFAQHIICEIEK